MPQSRETCPLDFEEFVLAFLSQISADDNYQSRLKSDRIALHRFFWELRQEGTIKDWVSDIFFDTNGTYPHSDEIDELFQELQLCGLLGRENPSYRYSDIKFKDRSYFKRLKDCVPEEKREPIDEAVKEFKNLFGIPALK